MVVRTVRGQGCRIVDGRGGSRTWLPLQAGSRHFEIDVRGPGRNPWSGNHY
jgi:hypothetical protein